MSRRLPGLLALLCLGLALPASEGPFLHPLFSEHMVFPCGVKAPVWGWSEPGAAVTVSLDGQTAETRAAADGRWQVTLGAFPAGRTSTLVVVSGAKRVALQDVVTGDVWLCSGQSNMSFGMRWVRNAPEEIAAAGQPGLRLFDIPAWLKQAKGCSWTPCTPETVAAGEHGYKQGSGFSAVAYFFGREVQRALGLPIGLVQTSIPGSPTETWCSREVLQRRCVAEDAGLEPVQLQRAQAASGGGGYNDLIRPLAPFAFKGVIWYQGESNVDRVASYRKLMPELIADWRALFAAQRLPFIMVQLPGYGRPDSTAWAAFREAQAGLARDGRDLGLAVTIDLGEAGDIHPAAKQEVGGRLALQALALVYGKEVEASGPVFTGLERSGATLRVAFSQVGKGLVSRGGPPTGFSLAGADQIFVAAEAVIADGAVVVSSAAVPAPLHVRYAWCDFPTCNLYNSAGLPAMPFRSDAP